MRMTWTAADLLAMPRAEYANALLILLIYNIESMSWADVARLCVRFGPDLANEIYKTRRSKVSGEPESFFYQLTLDAGLTDGQPVAAALEWALSRRLAPMTPELRVHFAPYPKLAAIVRLE
jgi:hypothetical protein